MSAPSKTLFLQELTKEPWYADVESEFQAAGVPDDVWESVLYGEDSTLDPTRENTSDPGPYGSVGLFQLNTDASRGGLGVGHTLSELTDPKSNAAIAAPVMANDLKGADAYLDSQLVAVSPVWNSMLTRGGRLSAETAIGASPFTPEPVAAAASTNNPTGSTATTPATDPTDALWSPQPITTGTFGLPDSKGWTALAQNVGIASIFLALIAGGFAIIASSYKGPALIPVPA